MPISMAQQRWPHFAWLEPDMMQLFLKKSGPLTLNFFLFPVVVELPWPTFSTGIGLFLILGNESFEVFEIQSFSNLGHDLLCDA